jgi:hypothetical protein
LSLKNGSKVLLEDQKVARQWMHGMHGSLCFLRQYLKGWNIKHDGDLAKEKSDRMLDLAQLDSLLDTRALSPEEWRTRYETEGQLERIYQMEEIHWQQMGNETWVLKGDSNTQFFHQFANGRRRKNFIRSLEGDRGEISGQPDIAAHVTNFYKNLFGAGS